MTRTQRVLITLLAVLLGGYFLVRGLYRPEAPVETPQEAARTGTAGSKLPATAAKLEDDNATAAMSTRSGAELRTPTATSPPQPVAEKPPELAVINEKTLVGTEWGSDQFKLEFGPAGELLIGGEARANWRIENGRIKLYSNDGREVHWLDIDGNKLTWNGEPIDRFK